VKRVNNLRDLSEVRSYATVLGVTLPLAENLAVGADAPLARPYRLNDKTVGNRFAILPMEGWDNTPDGKPTAFTFRRWQRWGASGAKLIMGAEAMAVSPEGRGSPSQLMIVDKNLVEIIELRDLLVRTHRERFGTSEDLLMGVQLTHSGRLSHPHHILRSEPRALYRNPLLDRIYNVQGEADVLTDAEIGGLVEAFIHGAVLAQQAGFDFVEIKHCHGYLGHEFLSAFSRPGPYGGSLENRTRFLEEIVAGIRCQAPGLDIAVRLSAVDLVPFAPVGDTFAPAEVGDGGYPYAFGGDGTGLGIDLAEPSAFLDVCSRLGIELVCISAGAGYNYHLMEPYFSSMGSPRHPPEDPLVGVGRLIWATAELKKLHPRLAFVGSGYSYLGRWLPHVAQAVITEGMADFVGIGRLSFSYPEIVADILQGRPLRRERLCRTCGYCGLAPFNGVISGCYLRDEFYRGRPEYRLLRDRLGVS
jgi:NADPH2 dehydrogenase